MSKAPAYPFKPRSTASLLPGQFWAVPLSSGGFACGRILQLGGEYNPSPQRAFLGGLLDWVGRSPPSADALAGARVIRAGLMHLRSITVAGGGLVLGCRTLEADGLQIPEFLSAMGGEGTMLLRGAEPLRHALPSEWGNRPVLGSWGYDFINQLADELLVGPLSPPT